MCLHLFAIDEKDNRTQMNFKFKILHPGPTAFTINYHMNNNFKENELKKEEVFRKIRITTPHDAIDDLTQTCELFFYNPGVCKKLFFGCGRLLSPVLLVLLLFSCEKPYPSVDELLPPGTFNLSTVITDSSGRQVDLSGDWAVFQDPSETKFTNFLHYDQTTETVYSVTYNDVFMMEYDSGRESLPVYEGGIIDKRRSVFLRGASWDLIYKDGRVHTDYRSYYILYHAAYSTPALHVIIDEDTLTFEDLPDVRLRRIKAFREEDH